jgi:hypothetical protein
MPEPRDECHPVLLPSGETIRVRGAEPMGPEAAAALGDVLDAARRRHAAEHPPNPAAEALWRRLRAALDARGIGLRDAAREAGVQSSALFRIGQGYLPDDGDMALLEHWLATSPIPTPNEE